MDMDLLFELLEDPAYRHVLLNHLPLTGLGFAWLVLAWGVIEKRSPSIVFGLTLVLLTSAMAIAVMDTGDDAYPVIYDRLDGISRDWLDHHTELADRWGRLLIGNAIAASAALGTGLWRRTWQRALAILVLGTTVFSLAAASVIAEAGGKIRHPEFRLSEPPSPVTSRERPCSGEGDLRLLPTRNALRCRLVFSSVQTHTRK
jgi:hypothetical protein